MAQYNAIKAQHSDALVMLYFDDVRAMAGAPSHATTSPRRPCPG
jgi:hypothetical protein